MMLMLKVQLEALGANCGESVTHIEDIIVYLRGLSSDKKVTNLILLPMQEVSSAMRCIKLYLPSTMFQGRLNHVHV